MDKKKALETALAQIEKAYGKGSVMRLGENTAMNVEAISTGSIALDLALGIGGVPRGRIVEIYGPESSGKTTLALHVAAAAQKDGGEAAFIDAEHALDPVYAKALGVDVDRMPVFSLPSARREEEEIREKAKGLIHRLALDSYMDEKASSLPYGAQRRLEIARALATSPDFLLLDEPAAGMNPQESTELMRFIRHIRDEFDLTILLIEHDMKVVMGVCQYIWVLEYGQLIAEGDPDAIRNNPRVIEAYLGEDVSNHA